MDEKRQFFRIKNKGEIHAKTMEHTLDVDEISSTGAVIIKKNVNLPKHGFLEIKVNNFLMPIEYEILKTVKNKMVLVFKNQEQINKLFLVLKHLRDEQKKNQ